MSSGSDSKFPRPDLEAHDQCPNFKVQSLTWMVAQSRICSDVLNGSKTPSIFQKDTLLFYHQVVWKLSKLFCLCLISLKQSIYIVLTRHDVSLMVFLSHRVRLPEWRRAWGVILRITGPTFPLVLVSKSIVCCPDLQCCYAFCSCFLNAGVCVTRPIACTGCVPNGFL